MIRTLEDMMKDFRNGVYDKTENGICTGCGSCCSNFLPLTFREVQKIKKYIKVHNITESKHIVPSNEPVLDMSCPFLNDNKAHRCKIYDIRPSICRAFKCSEPRSASQHPELYREPMHLVDCRKEFYGS